MKSQLPETTTIPATTVETSDNATVTGLVIFDPKLSDRKDVSIYTLEYYRKVGIINGSQQYNKERCSVIDHTCKLPTKGSLVTVSGEFYSTTWNDKAGNVQAGITIINL